MRKKSNNLESTTSISRGEVNKEYDPDTDFDLSRTVAESDERKESATETIETLDTISENIDKVDNQEDTTVPEMSISKTTFDETEEMDTLLTHILTKSQTIEKLNFITKLAEAEQECIVTERNHQHRKAKLHMNPETIPTVQQTLEIKKAPTAKQVESYIRLETAELERVRYGAKVKYHQLLRIYETIK